MNWLVSKFLSYTQLIIVCFGLNSFAYAETLCFSGGLLLDNCENGVCKRSLDHTKTFEIKMETNQNGVSVGSVNMPSPVPNSPFSATVFVGKELDPRGKYFYTVSTEVKKNDKKLGYLDFSTPYWKPNGFSAYNAYFFPENQTGNYLVPVIEIWPYAVN